MYSGNFVMQVEAAVAMLRKLRLPEYAAPDAQPGLPAFRLGALPSPQLRHHYQARSFVQCGATGEVDACAIPCAYICDVAALEQ